MTVLERVRRPSVHEAMGRDYPAYKVIAWMYLFAFDRLPTPEELVADLLKITDDGETAHDVIVEIMSRDGSRSDGHAHEGCSSPYGECKGRWANICEQLLGPELFQQTELCKWYVMYVLFIGDQQELMLTQTAEVLWPDRVEPWYVANRQAITNEVRRQRRQRRHTSS